MPWTSFMDMHSGGGTKEGSYEYIYIQAPEAEATVIFYNRFGHSPDRVSCTCCGEDYLVDESPSLEAATGYQRDCAYDDKLKCYVDRPNDGRWKRNAYIPLEEYLERSDVLVIWAEDIKPEERVGEVPREGYIWCD